MLHLLERMPWNWAIACTFVEQTWLKSYSILTNVSSRALFWIQCLFGFPAMTLLLVADRLEGVSWDNPARHLRQLADLEWYHSNSQLFIFSPISVYSKDAHTLVDRRASGLLELFWVHTGVEMSICGNNTEQWNAETFPNDSKHETREVYMRKSIMWDTKEQ